MNRLVGFILLCVLIFPTAAYSQSKAVISPENASQLTRIALLGTGSLTQVQWSDQAIVAAGTLGIFVYDPENLNSPPRLLQGHSSNVTTVAIYANRLVSGSDDRTIRVWDLGTGETLYTLSEAHTLGITNVVFNEDGTVFASASQDGMIRLWEVDTGESIGFFIHSRQAVVGIALVGETVLSASRDGSIKAWDRATLTESNQLEDTEITSLAVSADGRHFATSTENDIHLWDRETGEVAMTLRGHTAPINALTFDPTGTRLISASNDTSVRIWDVTTGELVHQLAGHALGVNSVAFSPNGKQLISTSLDRTTRIWDSETGQGESILGGGHQRIVHSIAFTSDSAMLVSASSDNTVRFWETQTFTQMGMIETEASAILTMALSPDDKTVATGHRDGSVHLWDIETLSEVTVFTGHMGSVVAVDFSFNGRLVASGSQDGTVRLWDTRQQRERAVLTGHQGGVNSVQFSPDGFSVASVGSDRTLWAWDVETGLPEGNSSDLGFVPRTLAYSPDAAILAMGASNGNVLMLGSNVAGTLPILSGTVWDIAFSPDSRLVAFAGVPNLVLMWSLEHNRPVNLLDEHRSIVRAVAFSPDGTLLATGSEDSTIQIWQIAE